MRKLLSAALLAALYLPFSFHASAQTATKPASKAPTARLVRNAAAVTPAATATTGSSFTEIALNWNFTPTIPACVSTNINCYDGFTFTLSVNGGAVTPIATPSVLGPTALSYNYVPGGQLPYGNYTFSLVANGYDGNGNPIVSPTPATVTVPNNVTALGSPTGLTGVTGVAAK